MKNMNDDTYSCSKNNSSRVFRIFKALTLHNQKIDRIDKRQNRRLIESAIDRIDKFDDQQN